MGLGRCTRWSHVPAMRRDAVKSPEPTRLLTAEEVAHTLGLSRGAVYQLSYLDRLPGKVKLGRRVRWQADAIERLVREGMAAACPS